MLIRFILVSLQIIALEVILHLWTLWGFGVPIYFIGGNRVDVPQQQSLLLNQPRQWDTCDCDVH